AVRAALVPRAGLRGARFDRRLRRGPVPGRAPAGAVAGLPARAGRRPARRAGMAAQDRRAGPGRPVAAPGADGGAAVVGLASCRARTHDASVRGTATVSAIAGMAMPESFIRNPMNAQVSAP